MRVILDLSELETKGLIELFGSYGFVIDQRYGTQPRREEPFVLRCIGEFPGLQTQFFEDVKRFLPCIVRLQRLPFLQEPSFIYWVTSTNDHSLRVQQALAALDAAIIGCVDELDCSRMHFKIRYAGPLSALEDIDGVWDAVLAAPGTDTDAPSERGEITGEQVDDPTKPYICVRDQEVHRLPLHIELQSSPSDERSQVTEGGGKDTGKPSNGD